MDKIFTYYKKDVLKIINLGCGNKPLKLYNGNEVINIDQFKTHKIVKVIDLEKNMLKDFKDDSIDVIFSTHFLEHINPMIYHSFLNDMYRVSKNGSIWHLRLPFDNPGTRTHPLHYRSYYFTSFKWFKPNINNKENDITLIQINKNPNIVKRLLSQIFPFMYKEIEFKLKVIKNG